MPIGYSISVVLLGLTVVCALRPPRRGGPLGTAAYLLGMVVNEAPVLAMCWGVGATLLALVEGDLDSALGRVSLGVLVVVLAGLGLVAWRSVRSRDVPERAVRDALGPGWRDEISPELAAGLRTGSRPVRSFLVPFLRRRLDVVRTADVPYADGGRRHTLDVYRNRSRPVGGPVLVHFHGGSFRSGSKNREAIPLLHRLASRGWVCVSANYRRGPGVAFPDHVVDAKRVLAWVREHGEEHGADPSVVVVAGSSSGAYLASFAALTADDPAFQPGFAGADTSVTAAVCLYGYYGPTDAARPDSSPAAHVRADAPPVFIVHGDRDSVIPVDGARAFAGALRETSHQPVVYTELPDAQHSFDYLGSLRTGLVVDRIEAFAAWVRSPHGPATPRSGSGPR